MQYIAGNITSYPPTSPASLAQHIAYLFTRGNILQLRC